MEQLITVLCRSFDDTAQQVIIPADVKEGLAVHGEIVGVSRKGTTTSANKYTITHVASGIALFSADMTHEQALELRERLIEEAEERGFDWTKDAEYIKREGQWCTAVVRDHLRNEVEGQCRTFST